MGIEKILVAGNYCNRCCADEPALIMDEQFSGGGVECVGQQHGRACVPDTHCDAAAAEAG